MPIVFDGPSFHAYYQSIDRIVRAELDKHSADYLLKVDPQECLDYLVAHAEWVPLEWHEKDMTVEPFSMKVTRRDEWQRDRTYTVDEQKFRLRIPTSGHPQLQEYLKFRPSSQWVSGEPEWKFQGDVLTMEVDATEAAVESILQNVRFWFGGRNKDIENGNAQLRERITPVWEGRRRQLEQQHGAAAAVLQKLNIPIHQAVDSRTKPVEITPRVLRTAVAKPAPKAKVKAEPTLIREDVLKLVDFIDQYARQFEISPRTYAKMDEEELRDLIVGMMNANYPGSTTAETFSKLGKTDIRLRVDEGNALVSECKVWKGSAGYVEALDQLFGYLTWRQNYGVLIIFSRRKEMTAVVDEAKKAARNHASFTPANLAEQGTSRFSTRYRHPQDQRKNVEVFNIFIDLSI